MVSCLYRGSRGSCLCKTHPEIYLFVLIQLLLIFFNYKKNVPGAKTVLPVASIGENRYDVFRSRDFSLARTTLNHSRLACYPAYV